MTEFEIEEMLKQDSRNRFARNTLLMIISLMVYGVIYGASRDFAIYVAIMTCFWLLVFNIGYLARIYRCVYQIIKKFPQSRGTKDL